MHPTALRPADSKRNAEAGDRHSLSSAEELYPRDRSEHDLRWERRREGIMTSWGSDGREVKDSTPADPDPPNIRWVPGAGCWGWGCARVEGRSRQRRRVSRPVRPRSAASDRSRSRAHRSRRAGDSHGLPHALEWCRFGAGSAAHMVALGSTPGHWSSRLDAGVQVSSSSSKGLPSTRSPVRPRAIGCRQAPPGAPDYRSFAASLRNSSGLVDAPDRRVVGAKGNSLFLSTICSRRGLIWVGREVSASRVARRRR
jgi:hypothetical protein